MTIPRNGWFRFSLSTMLLATALAPIFVWWLLRWPVEDGISYDEFGKRMRATHVPTLSNIVTRIILCACYLGMSVAWVRLYLRQKRRRRGNVEQQSE